jgi:hypothetical protein
MCLQDADVGYRLSCTSPALQFSLGPQPVAVCRVWPPPKANITHKLALVVAAHGISSSSKSTVQSFAASMTDAVPVPRLPAAGASITDTELMFTTVAASRAGTCPASWALLSAVGAAQATCSSSVAGVHLQPNKVRISKQRSRPPPVTEPAAEQPLATWTVLGSTADGSGQAAAAAAARSQHGKQL